jgi:hypothetical protein
MTQPVTNFGYDTSCTTALRTGRFSFGARLVAEACYRRLSTARGMLLGGEDEEDYGLDLADEIGQTSTPSTVAALPGRIQNELLKDERIASVTATVVDTTVGPSTSWNVSIEGVLADDTSTPFALVLAVSQVSVELLSLQTE